jgi:hypothetical protein
MDRWLEANNLQVTKSKPCAKKIVNVAGYPWRRIKQIGRSLTSELHANNHVSQWSF